MSRKFAVVTTFHDAGLHLYGQRMIDTFCQNWPSDVKLYLYPERCNPRVSDHSRIELRDLETSVPDLVTFKNKWKHVSKAIGTEALPPIVSPPKKQRGIGFKWNAVRFSHKVYAICHAALNTDADVLIWMDADTVCHSPIKLETIERLIPTDVDVCYLGREKKYSECGLYSLNLRSPRVINFINEFKRFYDDAEHGIFTLEEWHDSFVFDHVRRLTNLVGKDWSKGLIKEEGHPLINCEWGAYLDHLKGGRKKTGRSHATDLGVKRTESYWQ
jgi:hypothetical protein